MITKINSLLLVLLVVFVLLTTTEISVAQSTNRFTLGQAVATPKTLEMSSGMLPRRTVFVPGDDYGKFSRYSPTPADRVKIFNQNRHWLTGKVYDPVTRREIKFTDPWDAGHKYGHEFKRKQGSAIRSGKPSWQFRAEQRNLDIYRPELPSSNRSRVGEMPRSPNAVSRSPSPPSKSAAPPASRIAGRTLVFSRTAGTALLAAPEPVITTVIGIGISGVGHLAVQLLEQRQALRDAQYVSDQLDIAREAALIARNEANAANLVRKVHHIRSAANDIRKMID